jgi:hypothetical protein
MNAATAMHPTSTAASSQNLLTSLQGSAMSAMTTHAQTISELAIIFTARSFGFWIREDAIVEWLFSAKPSALWALVSG